MFKYSGGYILYFIIFSFYTSVSLAQNPNATYCPSPLIPYTLNNREADIERGYYLLDNVDCLMPCPMPFFTMKEWNNIKLMVSILAPISFFCVCMNLITYTVLNRKFDRHTLGIMFLSFSVFLMMLSDFLFIGGDWISICPNPGRYARQFDRSCAAAGLIFQYGAISAMLWWTSMAFDLWLVIRRIRGVKSYIVHYVVAINIAAIAFAIAPLFGKQYGYAVGGIGCWILENKWQNAVFWVPLAICLFFGIAFIFLICYEIYNIIMAVSKINGRNNSKKRIINLNLKPFIVVICLATQFIYCFIYHFYVEAKADSYSQSMSDYVMCLFATAGSETCQTLAKSVPYKSQMAFYFFLRIIGIEILLFYGFTKRTKKIWLNSIVFQNRFANYFKQFSPAFFNVSANKASSDGAGAPTVTVKANIEMSKVEAKDESSTANLTDLLANNNVDDYNSENKPSSNNSSNNNKNNNNSIEEEEAEEQVKENGNIQQEDGDDDDSMDNDSIIISYKDHYLSEV